MTYDDDPMLRGPVAEDEYRREGRAKEPFEGVTKDLEDLEGFERRQYGEFWSEYDARLSRAKCEPQS